MKTKSILSSLLCAGALLVCAASCPKTTSVNSTLFNAENLADDTATDAVHGFDTYFTGATNGLNDAGITELIATKTQVHDYAHKFGADLIVLDNLRLAYKANSADTNKSAAFAALAAVTAESSNIVNLVAPYISKAK